MCVCVCVCVWRRIERFYGLYITISIEKYTVNKV